MKQLWKTAVLTLLGTIFAVCLGMGVSAANGTLQGGDSSTFTWETDLDTGTLTITGEGYLPRINYEIEVPSLYPWAEDVDKIKTLVLKGKDICMEWYDYQDYYSSFIQTIVGEPGDGFSWTIDTSTKITTFKGEGPWPKDAYYSCFEEIVIAEGITDFQTTDANGQKLYHSLSGIYNPHWICRAASTVNFTAPLRAEYYIDPQNPYYASYDGCLYTKDYSKLLIVPNGKSSLTLHPDLKILGASCMSEDMVQNPLVLPWGVTTVEEQAFCFYNDNYGMAHFQVVLPDTLTNFALKGNYNYRASQRTYIFSDRNAALKSVLYTTEISDMGGQIEAEMVDSLEKYYPNVPEAQGPGPASAPTESKPEASSQPEPSAPESSVPASKPESSTPASQPASKPAESSASSQPPENKPAAESSAISSEPESSAVFSSENSVGAESFDESSESEETSQPEGLPTVERKVGGKVWWIVLAAIAVAVGAVVLLIKIKKK